MQTRLSSKGQVVLPQAIRRKLGLRAGDTLEADVRAGVVTLTPRKPRSRSARIVKDPLTGLPVLDTGEEGPILTSEAVRLFLEEFP
jgi:AbrB family looped-hinge helix DNA binding protein